MTSTSIKTALSALVEEIAREVMSEEVPMVTGGGDVNPLIGALNKTKEKIRRSPNTHPDVIVNQEKQIDALIAKLLMKRKGRATLNRGDIEKLDNWTKWMVFLPFGRAYRKGLAKYLRSKKDGPRKEDPFRDFRRYTYDDNMAFHEDVDWLTKEDQEPLEGGENPRQVSEEPVKYFHGTNLPDLKIGALILAPSKTGRTSEKGRLKNLDVVFFTKDPKSAKIYGDRAVHSFGGGVSTVYQVEPQGPITTLNDTPGTTVFHAPYARVTGKVNFKKKNKL